MLERIRDWSDAQIYAGLILVTVFVLIILSSLVYGIIELSNFLMKPSPVSNVSSSSTSTSLSSTSSSTSLSSTSTSSSVSSTTSTSTSTSSSTTTTLSFDFDERRLDYDMVNDLTVIGYDLAYVAEKNEEQFIIKGGRQWKAYDAVSNPTQVDGGLAYVASHGGNRHVVYNGVFKGLEHENSYDPCEVDGSLAYVAQDGVESVIIHEGENHGRQYDACYDPVDINGSLGFLCEKSYNYETHSEFLVFQGSKKKEYDQADSLVEVAGMPAYRVRSGDSYFVVWGDDRFGYDYDYVTNPVEINDSLAYVAGEDCTGFDSYEIRCNGYRLVYDGAPSSSFENIGFLTEVNDRPAYVVRSNTQEFVVYNDTMGKGFDAVRSIKEIDGELAYLTSDGIFYKDRLLGTDFTRISSYIGYQGDFWFTGMKNGAWYLVRVEEE